MYPVYNEFMHSTVEYLFHRMFDKKSKTLIQPTNQKYTNELMIRIHFIFNGSGFQIKSLENGSGLSL